MVSIKSDREIELMKEACRITAETHEMLGKIIKPGMSTLELDKIAEDFIKSKGGIPAQKGYPSGVRGVRLEMMLSTLKGSSAGTG